MAPIRNNKLRRAKTFVDGRVYVGSYMRNTRRVIRKALETLRKKHRRKSDVQLLNEIDEHVNRLVDSQQKNDRADFYRGNTRVWRVRHF